MYQICVIEAGSFTGSRTDLTVEDVRTLSEEIYEVETMGEIIENLLAELNNNETNQYFYMIVECDDDGENGSIIYY